MAETVFLVASGIALLALVLAGLRMALGPTAVDRTVALDGMTIIALSLIAAWAWFSGRGIYLDVALVYGLASFAGVVAIARYLEGGLK
ncbi:MAG: pH regulation protein F [Spirochaetales bacterium]|nr:pH regulation protein F [Spirochaetales bacterium]